MKYSIRDNGEKEGRQPPLTSFHQGICEHIVNLHMS